MPSKASTVEASSRTNLDVASHTAWILRPLHPEYHMDGDTLRNLTRLHAVLEAVEERGFGRDEEEVREYLMDTCRRIVASAVAVYGADILPPVNGINDSGEGS